MYGRGSALLTVTSCMLKWVSMYMYTSMHYILPDPSTRVHLVCWVPVERVIRIMCPWCLSVCLSIWVALGQTRGVHNVWKV